MVESHTVAAFVEAARRGNPDAAVAILRGTSLLHTTGVVRPTQFASPEQFLEVVLANLDTSLGL